MPYETRKIMLGHLTLTVINYIWVPLERARREVDGAGYVIRSQLDIQLNEMKRMCGVESCRRERQIKGKTARLPNATYIKAKKMVILKRNLQVRLIRLNTIKLLNVSVKSQLCVFLNSCGLTPGLKYLTHGKTNLTLRLD